MIGHMLIYAEVLSNNITTQVTGVQHHFKIKSAF